jgi:TonB family protein
MTFPGAALVALFCIVIAATRLAAQAPLTPGAAAALVFPKDQEDRARLTAAVADPAPQVRVVAARVAAVLQRSDLVPALTAALTQEQDRLAASEQARAILLLERESAAGAAAAAAKRLGGPVAVVWAEWLARNDTARLASVLSALTMGTADDEAWKIGRIAAMAVQQTPAQLDQVTQAVIDGARIVAWSSYLDGIAERGLDAERPLILGIGAIDATVRAASWWSALSSATVAESVKPVLLAALAAETPQESPWAQAARQLAARRLNRATAIDQSGIFREHPKEVRSNQSLLARLPELTEIERQTLRSMLGESYPVELPASRASVPAKPRVTTARNLTQIVPGLVNSVLSVTGCKTTGNADILIGARMVYRLDGRPREIGIDASRASQGCAEAIRILANLSLSESDEAVVPDRAVWALLPIETSIVACLDETPVEGVERVTSGRIVAPRKIKNVNPQYPQAAQKAGIQGVVFIEATIGTSGCVQRAAVTRGVALALDIEALRTVSQWRFSPTLLDGQPVPVLLTVTVNFTLR